MNKTLFGLLCFLLCRQLAAQPGKLVLETIPNTPSKTIYDLFIDKDKLLWIACETGVYRYDGISFSLFSSPDQSSMSASGLMQDGEGKIWFRNFSGQIFYIKNEKTYLLESYISDAESRFPEIALCNGMLIATSDKGLFVCDTKTLKSAYIKCGQPPVSGIHTISVVNNSVLAFGKAGWFICKPGSNTKLRKVSSHIGHYLNQKESPQLFTVHPDTTFLITNPSGTLNKIGVKGDSLVLFGQHIYKEFINTISVTGKNVWLNTQKSSVQLPGTLRLSDRDISDVAIDGEGNTWFSSLEHGLLVSFKPSAQVKINFPGTDSTEIVKSLARYKDQLLLGIQSGKLFVYDYNHNRIVRKVVLPENLGSIRKIIALQKDKFLIGTSIHTYELNIESGSLRLVPPVSSLKQAVRSDDMLFATTANGLIIMPDEKSEISTRKVFRLFKGVSEYNEQNNLFRFGKRCEAIAYHPGGKTLFVAFKNSLFTLNEKGLSPVIFNEKQVYAQALLHCNGKIYIGTVNNGLLVYSHGKMTRFSIEDGLLNPSILKLREDNDKVFILSAGAIQTFDTKTNRFNVGRNLSTADNILTTDLMPIDNDLYLATIKGFYRMPLAHTEREEKLINFLLPVTVNNSLLTTDSIFAHDQTNLQFRIAVPIYSRARQTYIKYCLVTDTDSSWNVTSPGGRTINFASLEPGNYSFIAYAVNPELGQAAAPIVYRFEILRSWWENKSFQALVVLLIISFSVYILISYFLNKRTFRRILHRQQESIMQERQRISSEIHDDIGAGIFAIKLFADRERENLKDKEDIGYISLIVNDMAQKIREIIWSTNVENDNLPDLITYLKYQSIDLFEHSETTFVARIPDDIPQVTVAGRNRREILLLVKEFLHNAIRHSNASRITLDISIRDKFLDISIRDNGKGMDLLSVKANSMGLKNAKARMERLQGAIDIQIKQGTQIFLEIPFDELDF